MAVRAFDVSDEQDRGMTLLAPATRSRREVRHARHTYASIALVSVSVPFLAALVVLGVGR